MVFVTWLIGTSSFSTILISLHLQHLNVIAQSQAQFNTYVKEGTVLNNYAHIFDILIRLRQVRPDSIIARHEYSSLFLFSCFGDPLGVHLNFFYLILSYLILSYLILSYLILSYLISSYLILSYLILSYLK